MQTQDNRKAASLRPEISFKDQRGGALAIVIPALIAVLTLVLLFIRSLSPDGALAARHHSWRQAYLIAESGVWFSLYEQRLAFGKAADKKTDSNSTQGISWTAPPDSLSFLLNPDLIPPERRASLKGGWLEILSTGEHRDKQVSIHARFGRALDPTAFGTALTLYNDSGSIPLSPLQVRGRVRLKTPQPNWESEPLADQGLLHYADAFVEDRYQRLESRLREALALEGHDAGNGRFDSYHAPDFSESEIWAFPLGELEIVHDGEEPLVIRGPGTLAAHSDIRIRGKVRLENLELVAGRDIILEGEAQVQGDLALLGRLGLLGGLHGEDVVCPELVAVAQARQRVQRGDGRHREQPPDPHEVEVAVGVLGHRVAEVCRQVLHSRGLDV
jgi:hypothetical protein